MSTDWKAIEGSVLSSEAYSTRNGVLYLVSFNYKVDGSWFGNTMNTDAPYEKGDTITVEYDPRNPERNRFTADNTRQKWIVGCVVVGMFLIIAALEFLAGFRRR